MNFSLTQFSRRYRLWILAAITLLGALFRLYQIEALPPGDGYDVAQYGLDALEIWDGARPIYLTTNFGREVLFSYLVSLVYIFTGPGTLGIHLSSAIVGILTIPAVYLAGRELLAGDSVLVRTWVPLLAALTTAVSYWHLNWSRVGLRVIWVPFFAALITAVLWRGLTTGSRKAFVFAGVLLGLSLYTYQAARLLPLLVLFAFIITYIDKRPSARPDFGSWGVTFLFALLVASPLIFYAWQNPGALNDRLRQTTLISGPDSLLQELEAVGGQSLAALKMFFIEGDSDPLFTIPGRPSLNPFLGTAFLLGLLISLWRWRRPPYFYLFGWLILLTMPAMVAGQAATAKRALGAFPAVAMLIGIGLAIPLHWVLTKKRYAEEQSPEKSRLWVVLLGSLVVIIAAGFAWTAVITFRDYFLVWGQDRGLDAHFQRDHLEVGAAIGQLPDDERAYLSPFPASHPSIQLHAGRHAYLTSYDGHFCLPLPGPDANGTTYVIVPGPEERSLDSLADFLPGGKVVEGPQRGDKAEPFYFRYQVPPGVTADIQPEYPADLNWDEKMKLIGYDLPQLAYHPGETLKLILYYEVLAETTENYTRFIHLMGAEREGVGQTIWAQEDSEPCQGYLPTSNWQKGEIIIDNVEIKLTEDLPAGTYSLLTGFYTWPELTRVGLVNQEEGRLDLEIILMDG